MANNKLNYTEALSRIEEIVLLLNEEDLPLEKMMEYIREATGLIKLCEDSLLAYEEELNDLLSDNE
jgi:exodeoxyribonuclease VII small subunit